MNLLATLLILLCSAVSVVNASCANQIIDNQMCPPNLRDGIPDGGRCTGGDCCLAACAERPSCNGGYEVVNYDSGYAWPCPWQSFGCCKYHSPPPPPPPGEVGGGGALGAIIGGVVGGLVFIALIVVLVVIIKKNKQPAAAAANVDVQQQAPSNDPSNPAVAAGTPVATNAVSVEMPEAASGKKSVSLKLEELGCGQYESALADQGYVSMASLQGLTKEEAGAIADDIKMKPGHKKRFVDGIAK